MEDKERLLSGKWLNCRLIEAAQSLLSKAFPYIEGLQTPLNGEMFKFKRAVSTFVQILNVERSHWIVVSNVGCKKAVVNIYDSAYNFLSLNTKKQICSLWQPSSDQVEFKLVNVQRQPNSSDCGLFAIANATELAHGRDPLLCTWNTCQMREHLFSCIERGKMEQFPLMRPRRIPVGKSYKKSVVENIYCTCRLPNDPTIAMICCDECGKWYHKRCEGIGLNVNMKNKMWHCTTCK